MSRTPQTQFHLPSGCTAAPDSAAPVLQSSSRAAAPAYDQTRPATSHSLLHQAQLSSARKCRRRAVSPYFAPPPSPWPRQRQNRRRKRKQTRRRRRLWLQPPPRRTRLLLLLPLSFPCLLVPVACGGRLCYQSRSAVESRSMSKRQRACGQCTKVSAPGTLTRYEPCRK